jgi:hypothetical protein
MSTFFFSKKYYKPVIAVVVIVMILGFGAWFWGKFFPAQVDSWSPEKQNDLSKSYVPDSGWNGDNFQTTLDFPGGQNICISIATKKPLANAVSQTVKITQAQRAALYPVAGNYNDFLELMTPAKVEEEIRQDKPFFIGHLINNITREGKDLFFLGENEKFLIPTKSIFTANFPTQEIPGYAASVSDLPYANVLVRLPEGILVSDGKGVFVTSQGTLFLVRSPEVFESLGYKWEDVKNMDEDEKNFNPYLGANLIDFDAANPNGTILKNSSGIFLVWGEKLYQITADKQAQYFPAQPVVETTQKNLTANCQAQANSHVITCCASSTVDPRLSPPANYPFMNTLQWNLAGVAAKAQVTQINWQAKMAVNQENTLKRLGSFKNYVLYGLGIVK